MDLRLVRPLVVDHVVLSDQYHPFFDDFTIFVLQIRKKFLLVDLVALGDVFFRDGPSGSAIGVQFVLHESEARVSGSIGVIRVYRNLVVGRNVSIMLRYLFDDLSLAYLAVLVRECRVGRRFIEPIRDDLAVLRDVLTLRIPQFLDLGFHFFVYLPEFQIQHDLVRFVKPAARIGWANELLDAPFRPLFCLIALFDLSAPFGPGRDVRDCGSRGECGIGKSHGHENGENAWNATR